MKQKTNSSHPISTNKALSIVSIGWNTLGPIWFGNRPWNDDIHFYDLNLRFYNFSSFRFYGGKQALKEYDQERRGDRY